MTISDVGLGFTRGAGWASGPRVAGGGLRPSPAQARRRPVVLAGAAAVTVVACLWLSGALDGGSGLQGRSGFQRVGAVPAGVARAGARVYVVRPGDTIWGIATTLAGDGDPRPIMQALERQIGGGAVVVGQRLCLVG